MPIQNFQLDNGDTLEVTSTENEIISTKLVDTKTTYITSTTKIIPGTIPIPNKLPLVAAGIDQQIKLPANEVTLTGAVSDSDGAIKTIAWTKLAGPACNMLTPGVISTKVTGMVVGDYMFRLTAMDDKGGAASDDLNVKVLAADPVDPIPIGKYLSLPTSNKIIAANSQIIENLQFKNMADNAIRAGNCSIVLVRNCFFNGCGAEAIEVENATTVIVENCLFARVTTCVYALSSSNIKVNRNQFVNVRMRIINGNESGRGQFVQFNGVGGAGNEIMNNKGENWLGESNPEDIISLYASSGTASSPIKIIGNMFRGGGPSSSGGGIMTGDNGGSWQIVENNVLLNPGQYGIAAAGGFNIQLVNNKIWAKQQPFSNNPLYVWGQAGAGGGNITVKGNMGKWIDRGGGRNDGWNSGNLSNVSFEYLTDVKADKTLFTEADLNVPLHLIDMISPAELLTIRK